MIRRSLAILAVTALLGGAGYLVRGDQLPSTDEIRSAEVHLDSQRITPTMTAGTKTKSVQ